MWYREESVIKNSHLRNKSICTSLYFSGKLNTEALKLEKDTSSPRKTEGLQILNRFIASRMHV